MLRSLLTRRFSFSSSVRRKVCPGPGRFRPRVESLDERTLPAATATTTLLGAAPNPAVVNDPITLTATVAAVPPGAGTPTGNVTFLDGTAPLISVPLDGTDHASFTTVLPFGEHVLSAEYTGDATFSLSASPTFTEQVHKAATTVVTLPSSATAALTGHPVTLTATVTAVPPGLITPTGTVTFFDNGSPLGVGTLNGLGVATFTTSGLAFGHHTFSALYGGDANFLSSQTQVVNPPGTTVARIFQGSRRRQPVLQVFAADGVTLRYEFPLSQASFRSGARFNASGDFNGDGTNDVVVISNPSPHGALLEVFDGRTGAVLLHKFPYKRGFTGRVHVTVRADGSFADVITSAVVDGQLVHRFFKYRSPHPTTG